MEGKSHYSIILLSGSQIIAVANGPVEIMVESGFYFHIISVFVKSLSGIEKCFKGKDGVIRTISYMKKGETNLVELNGFKDE